MLVLAVVLLAMLVGMAALIVRLNLVFDSVSSCVLMFAAVVMATAVLFIVNAEDAIANPVSELLLASGADYVGLVKVQATALWYRAVCYNRTLGTKIRVLPQTYRAPRAWASATAFVPFTSSTLVFAFVSATRRLLGLSSLPCAPSRAERFSRARSLECQCFWKSARLRVTSNHLPRETRRAFCQRPPSSGP